MQLVPLALSLSVALGALAAFAAQDKKPAAAAPAMQAVKPGAHHKVLERKVGTWDATVTIPGIEWAAPSTAVYTAKLDHGGLWLVADYRGTFNGQPFTGHEVQGFDALKDKFVGTWVDSMMDHIMSFEGAYDEKTQTLAMFTDSFDLDGKPIKERHDTKFVDADNWVFTMNQLSIDGAYKPTMTITYKRKK
jgi:hypothetical protein